MIQNQEECQSDEFKGVYKERTKRSLESKRFPTVWKPVNKHNDCKNNVTTVHSQRFKDVL